MNTTQPVLFGLGKQNRPNRPLTIRELPASERPLTRLTYSGSGVLSLPELLAILIGGNDALTVANNILAHVNDIDQLAKLTVYELEAIYGVGPTIAGRIHAAFELGRRLLTAQPEERPQVRSPADVANLLMLEMGLLETEHLRTVLLDTKNFVTQVVNVYAGSLNTAVVRVAEVFREAIRANSAGIVIVHNHPSGDPTPSPQDITLTETIVEAGKLMDIDVLDHIIIGRNRFVSLKERGLGFR